MKYKFHIPTQQYGFLELETENPTNKDLKQMEGIYNRYAEAPMNFNKGKFKEYETFTGETILRKKDRYFETKALQLWLEGLTFLAIGHLLGFSDDTISKWLRPYVKKLEPLQLDRKKLTGKVKQYKKIILVEAVNAN